MSASARTATLLALAVLGLAPAACSSGDDQASAGSTSSAATSTAGTYTTQEFAVPFTVTVDSAVLQKSPTTDSEHLVYFDSVDGARKMRFLAPTNVFPPGSSATMDLPRDFIGYLHDQAANGITLSAETTTAVDGRPATLVSVSSDGSRPEGFYDGSLGCISRDESHGSEDGCFGVQPDLPLRLAVIDVDGMLLLAWARPDEDPRTSEDDFHRAFEATLSTLQFG